MAELKTTANDDGVDDFLAGVADPRRREDARRLCQWMRQATGVEPVMWGSSIIGFGSFRYKYASGRTGETAAVGFSPRRQNLVLYIMSGFDGYQELLSRLGKHSTGKACLYLKRLDDVDEQALRELVAASFNEFNGTGDTG